MSILMVAEVKEVHFKKYRSTDENAFRYRVRLGALLLGKIKTTGPVAQCDTEAERHLSACTAWLLPPTTEGATLPKLDGGGRFSRSCRPYIIIWSGREF